MRDRSKLVSAAALVALGLSVGGWLAGEGVARARLGDRFVTVKGVSEREVRADLAIWPLTLTESGNDLQSVQRALETDVERTLEFLERAGLPAAAAQIQGVRVQDGAANVYRNGPITTRFVVTQSIVVRSSDLAAVEGASQGVGDLVAAGVVLQSGPEYGQTGPTYLFTALNDLKPEMIAEATARAREAAQEFARDSESRLGGIRQANQGVFQILPRDQAPGISESGQIEKVVRVVSTVQYLLRD